MTAANTAKDNLNQTGQNLIRVLIASYFDAVSVGMINGTNATPLVAVFLPDAWAHFAGSSIIFVLAYMVMTGIWLRPAAMLLGLIMFWSSYILNFSPEGPIMVGDFWRDLTLVGALMLTYVKSGPRASQRRAMFRKTPQVRHIKPDTYVGPRRVVANSNSTIERLPEPAESNVAFLAVDNIFLDDANDLRNAQAF